MHDSERIYPQGTPACAVDFEVVDPPPGASVHLRRFYFDRQVDVSGTSGTGAIVEGVEFSDGQVVLRWRTSPHSSIGIYKSMEAAVYIHGHNGSTNLHYIDPLR